MTSIAKEKQPMPKGAMATVYGILLAISTGHLVNDSIQSVVPAMYPILEHSLHITYAQIGLIAFMLNMTSSVMQPVFGVFADRRPTPFLLPFGMFMSTLGLIGFSISNEFWALLASVIFIGLGSAVFHPEGSRVAYMAAGSKRGLAQSIYQVGGNAGQSLAPLFTALIFVPLGQRGGLWFTFVTVMGIILLFMVSRWYSRQPVIIEKKRRQGAKPASQNTKIQQSISGKIKWAMVVLVFFVFARSWYYAGISNFYQFYLLDDYGLSIQEAQIYLFVFLVAGVLGTFFGGPLADRFGRRNIIAVSMLGSAPLAVLLPHVPLWLVIPMIALIGFILMTSFSVTVVYAQELMPKKVGMASGLIVGLAFGMGGVGSVLFGSLADLFSIRFVMIFCSLLPLFGLVSWLLPRDEKVREITGQ
ncbi:MULTISPECIES: MFS transporter [Bacillus]|jgi:FSR family fosmidomycin resistance protein-like MFS transporter|uniref:MFS transporter n=1 Tax=Bacillus TaxID=1386 RepID=UPI00065E1893|nr:MFS transporter [Bacillus smithii]AKP46950.1 fosmidomycin resistance protein [Bacillus smithii]MED4882796.1 MFS transporter [Bacillus smithii]MED4926827.1 MFS transporter [Bacillus smithii]